MGVCAASSARVPGGRATGSRRDDRWVDTDAPRARLGWLDRAERDAFEKQRIVNRQRALHGRPDGFGVGRARRVVFAGACSRAARARPPAPRVVSPRLSEAESRAETRKPRAFFFCVRDPGIPPRDASRLTASPRDVPRSETLSQARVRLSASLVPADAALANRGGVPLGAVVHPFRARRVADDDEDDGGALFFSSTSVRKQPARCETCGAFVNGFCVVNARNGHWACCFCGSGNTHRSLIVPLDADAAALPELAAREVEYAWTPSRDDSKSPQLSDLRATSVSEGSVLRTTYASCEPSRPPVVFVLDESLDVDESRLTARLRRRARWTRCRTAPGWAWWRSRAPSRCTTSKPTPGLGSTDATVAAAASVVPGHRSPERARPVGYLDEKRGGPTVLARLGDEGVRETLAAIVASLAPVGNCREGAARTAAELPRRRRRNRRGGARDASRATRSTTRKTQTTASRGRVIVCLGGPPTRGPGAAAADEQSEFYDAEERAARAYVETLAETVRFFSFSRDNPFPFGVTETFSARVSPRVSSRTVTPPRGRLDPLGDVLLA